MLDMLGITRIFNKSVKKQHLFVIQSFDTLKLFARKEFVKIGIERPRFLKEQKYNYFAISHIVCSS